MARIFRKSDRIVVRIDDVTVKLAPLTIHQKVEIQTAMLNGRANGDLKEATNGVTLALKYSMKGIDGVFDDDGNAYKLEFDGDVLSDACVDELMNLEMNSKLSIVCAGILNGIPGEFTDHLGNKLDGVEVVKTGKEDAPKNV